jgi:protein SCO1/2
MQRKSFYIAIAVIAVPVLIYLVGKGGKQQFKGLPYYGEKIEPNGKDITDTIFYSVPDFHFTDQSGNAVSRQTFDNSIYIANFFFASCKDVCPRMNAEVGAVYQYVGEQHFSEIRFLSITVDPENDSVPVLAAYARKFHADPGLWHFATGSMDEVVHAGRGFLLPVSKEDKTIDHSQNLMLVDKANHIRGIYNGLDEVDIKRLKEDLKALLYEYHKPKQ